MKIKTLALALIFSLVAVAAYPKKTTTRRKSKTKTTAKTKTTNKPKAEEFNGPKLLQSTTEDCPDMVDFIKAFYSYMSSTGGKLTDNDRAYYFTAGCNSAMKSNKINPVDVSNVMEMYDTYGSSYFDSGFMSHDPIFAVSDSCYELECFKFGSQVDYVYLEFAPEAGLWKISYLGNTLPQKYVVGTPQFKKGDKVKKCLSKSAQWIDTAGEEGYWAMKLFLTDGNYLYETNAMLSGEPDGKTTRSNVTKNGATLIEGNPSTRYAADRYQNIKMSGDCLTNTAVITAVRPLSARQMKYFNE